MAAHRKFIQAIFPEAAGKEGVELPPELQRRAAARLPSIVLIVGAFVATTIPLRHLLQKRPEVLVLLEDVVAGTFAILSLLAFIALRYGKWKSGWLLPAGLAYEVLLCFALALSEAVLQSTGSLPLRLSMVSVVLLIFPLIAPAPPRYRLIATLLCALTQPAALTISSLFGGGLSPVAILLTSAPTLVVAGLSIWLGQVVHRLRVHAGRGLSFGRYELVEPLGMGGMGEVWLARHTHLLQPAAVKLIRADEAGVVGEGARARFLREARAISALRSPHTVGLLDSGATDDGTLYYAMELLEGIDLHELVGRFGPQSEARVLHLLAQVTHSLSEAHALGLVHRDIKPANILLCRLGDQLDFAKVLDFGLVKSQIVAEDGMVSMVGAISGTPGFVAPEHLEGLKLDGRADLYSLGCVAYFLLCGRAPFSKANRVSTLRAHLNETPPPPSTFVGRPIDPRVETLVMSLLARDREQRPQDAGALRHQISRCQIEGGFVFSEDQVLAWWSEHLPELLEPKTALAL